MQKTTHYKVIYYFAVAQAWRSIPSNMQEEMKDSSEDQSPADPPNELLGPSSMQNESTDCFSRNTIQGRRPGWFANFACTPQTPSLVCYNAVMTREESKETRSSVSDDGVGSS